jgi:hypothetical protein
LIEFYLLGQKIKNKMINNQPITRNHDFLEG